jgi:translation initiation factor 5B
MLTSLTISRVPSHVLSTVRRYADAVNIAVSGINIGPVHKRDVLRANVMNERGHKKYAVILAFDVPVTKEAREMAQEFNVRIFTADIIYHLFDQVIKAFGR